MSNQTIREYVKSVYPNDKWSKTVDHMPDYQVFAIYQRFIALQAFGHDDPLNPRNTLPDGTRFEQLKLDI